MSTGSFEGHSPAALLAIIVLGLLGAATLAVYGCTTLARRGVRASSPTVRYRSLAALAAGAAVAVYVWGAVHLLVLDGSARDDACKRAVGAARAMHIDAYRPTYIPLRLGCHVAGGRTYSVGVPGYANPTVLALAALAVVLAVAAALESERKARQEFSRESES